MRVVRQTPELYRVARHRLYYLESLLPDQQVGFNRQLDRDVAFATVELLNCWARFSRSMYFSVCSGARDANGVRITTNVGLTDYLDAQLFAASQFTRRPLIRGKVTHREEPNWLDPAILQKLLKQVGASNEATVDAALSLQTRVFRDLPSVRNFFGHRGKDTALKAAAVGRNYGKPGSMHPTDLCLAYAPGRPQSILLDWSADIRTIMKVASA